MYIIYVARWYIFRWKRNSINIFLRIQTFFQLFWKMKNCLFPLIEALLDLQTRAFSRFFMTKLSSAMPSIFTPSRGSRIKNVAFNASNFPSSQNGKVGIYPFNFKFIKNPRNYSVQLMFVIIKKDPWYAWVAGP